MKAVRKDVRLVMVGDGDARPELENIIRANGLSERITLTGSLDNAGVQGWLSRSAALVLPSFYESQGIVLMEANAAGLPVIAHRVGGVAEVVEHGKNGFLLENNQPHTIAQAVNALFSRPGLAKSMGQCGRLLVRQRFSWDRIALHTLVVYEGLLRQHQPYKATIGRAGRLEAAAQFPIFHPQPAVNF